MKISLQDLEKRSKVLLAKLQSCDLCPHACKINRKKGALGLCKAPYELKVSSTGLHFGEEPPISGKKGSGTVFFAHCNLHCVYCQNWDISQVDTTTPYYQTLTTSPRKLALEMISLQKKRAHNINLVSPTHYSAQIVKTLAYAKSKGLKIPIVYNTNGYDSKEVLKLLDGIVDIYLPDIKYSDNNLALKYSKAKNYVEFNQKAIKEMFRQVGNLEVDSQGVAKRGLLVRHLVLPNNIAGSKKSLEFLYSLSPKIHVNIMDQYRPTYLAHKYSEIGRSITSEEFDEVVEFAKELGLVNVML